MFIDIYIHIFLYSNILYAVTAVHDYDAFIKLQNVWFFNVCCFACDAIKFKKKKNCAQNTLPMVGSK
jgi:hypothetical protein